MIRTINITAAGAVTLNFGARAVHCVLEEPLLPGQIADALAELRDALTALGGSELHLEAGPFRSFRHVVKGGEVIAGDLAPAALFNALMAAEEEIVAALAPPPEPEPDPEPETPPDPDATAPETTTETGDPAP
jgi:hypothetical protein